MSSSKSSAFLLRVGFEWGCWWNKNFPLKIVRKLFLTLSQLFWGNDKLVVGFPSTKKRTWPRVYVRLSTSALYWRTHLYIIILFLIVGFIKLFFCFLSKKISMHIFIHFFSSPEMLVVKFKTKETHKIRLGTIRRPEVRKLCRGNLF